MNTARWMIPMILAMSAGCKTTLDESSLLRTSSDLGGNVGSEDAACFVTGAGRTIAPKGLVRRGIELVSTASGLALGFNRTPDDAVTLNIDPASAMTMGSLSRHPPDPLRRLTPIDRAGNLMGMAIDVDRKASALQDPVTVAAKEPFVIGTTDSGIGWASSVSESPRALWSVAEGNVRDLRGIALSDGGFAVIFRQGGSLWFGRLSSDKMPAGPLDKIAERANLRTPTLAESGDEVMIIWTEQHTNHDTWSLAGVSVARSGRRSPVLLDLPMESAGSDAIRPALAAVDGGHFLLVWTEGPVWSHQVRALTIESHGHAVGPALRVSSGVESGWGRPALTADGRGAVVYFVPTEGGFAVAATPIACPLSSMRTAKVSTRL